MSQRLQKSHWVTHGVAWKEEELLYNAAAVNQYSCPGWSFYDYAPDPGKDMGVQRALETSDAPWCAVTEWLLFHDDQSKWTTSLKNALSPPKVCYIYIFNWNSIINKSTIHQAIKSICE